MKLSEDLKVRYPELEWKTIIAQYTECNLCHKPACPEVVKVPQIAPHPDEVKAGKQAPITPFTLLACCSECGEFWYIC